MHWGTPESLISRHRPSRIFCCVEGRNEVKGRSDHVKHLIFHLAQIVFVMFKMIYDK
jgi:hypothetical protein